MTIVPSCMQWYTSIAGFTTLLALATFQEQQPSSAQHVTNVQEPIMMLWSVLNCALQVNKVLN